MKEFILCFTEIVNDFKSTYSFIFERNYCFTEIDDLIVNIQVHGFSDTSLMADGCRVYLRIERKRGCHLNVILLNVTWFQ